MTELVQIRPGPVFPQHCGVGRKLHVRNDLLQAAMIRGAAAKRIGLPHRNCVTIHIGEIGASKFPIVLDTVLGSCVSVCIYDPILRAGGMNHILLPGCPAGETSPRCGIHAMELLINAVMNLGGDRRRFIAKAFGGANVLGGINMPPVGDRNAKFVRDFLATEKIRLVAERLGGDRAVHVYFRADTGKATVHTVDGSSLPKIIAAESRYQRPPTDGKSFAGEITLF